ncbi:MAG: hypothetical protein NVSMB52_16630 [Chloroflexota bacterium]
MARFRRERDLRPKYIRALLAMHRSALVWQLLGLDEAQLTQQLQPAGKSVAALLRAAGDYDTFHADLIDQLKGNTERENAEEVSARDISLGSTTRLVDFEADLAHTLRARKRLLAALARVPGERNASDPHAETTNLSVAMWLLETASHDAELSAQIRIWRDEHQFPQNIGSLSLLLAGLRAARKELLTTVALRLEEDDTEIGRGQNGAIQRPLADVTYRTFELLHGLQAGVLSQLPSPSHLTWEETWRSLHESHLRVLHYAARASSTALQSTVQRGGVCATAYSCLVDHAAHDRECAKALRIGMDDQRLIASTI